MKNLIVISSYPEQNLTHGKQTVGVASYTKNTLLNLPKTLNITVLAENLKQETSYKQNNISVKRIWDRNHPFVGLQLINNLRWLPPHPILLEFEVAMLGNPSRNIWLPIILLFCRLRGQKTTLVIHQVIQSLSEMGEQIGQNTTSPTLKLLDKFLKYFYITCCHLSTKVVVFEDFLKFRLTNLGIPTSKVQVIPHGIEQVVLQKTKSNPTFTLTLFGYLAWYKGSLWLAKIIKDLKNVRLVLAGGPNPNHLNKPYYQKYLASLYYLQKKYPNKITITGYVDQNKIQDIYNTSDCLVFPYLVGMSSSGPLSLAFSYQKPFLVSTPLSLLLQTTDIKQNSKALNLDLNTLIFNLDSNDFKQKLDNLIQSQSLQLKLQQLGHLNSITRNWQNIGKMYLDILSK